MYRPVALIILDGWGYSREKTGNAIANALTPNIDAIRDNFPALLLQASGKGVGLTWGEPGNSEVGHLTIGAGRVIFQYLERINKSIQNGDFFSNDALGGAAQYAKKNGSRLHLIGLLTSGSVHANLNHLFALIDLAKKEELERVYLHLFTDGKDSGPKEAVELIGKVEQYAAREGTVKLGTLIGRDFSMDRDNNWDRTEMAFNLLTKGAGERSESVIDAVSAFYKKGITDTFLPPTVIDPDSVIRDHDAVVFFNFREDSMRQIAHAFTDKDFGKFERVLPANLYIAAMTQYFADPALRVAFAPPEIKNCLAEAIANAGKKQLHIAETVKYAHVTYFLNGFRDGTFAGEDSEFFQSVRDHVAEPKMRAVDIGNKIVDEIKKGSHDLLVANFANADVLAHLGSYKAAITGIETIDEQVGRIRLEVLKKGGAMVITSDHGNAEALYYKGLGDIETKHNANPVPCYIVASGYERPRDFGEADMEKADINGILADVAPTVLDLMGIEKPAEMTGESLLKLVK